MGDWRYANFTKEEMQCRCGCGMLPTEEFMVRLQELRDELDFPLPVTSGARCPAHNQAVASTGDTGPHTYGLAADISVYGTQAHKAIATALKLGFTGVGVKQKGNHLSRFVHFDIVPVDDSLHPRPWIWTY